MSNDIELQKNIHTDVKLFIKIFLDNNTNGYSDLCEELKDIKENKSYKEVSIDAQNNILRLLTNRILKDFNPSSDTDIDEYLRDDISWYTDGQTIDYYIGYDNVKSRSDIDSSVNKLLEGYKDY